MYSSGTLQLQGGTLYGNIESYDSLVWTDTVVVGDLYNEGHVEIQHSSQQRSRLQGHLTLAETSRVVTFTDVNKPEPFRITGTADLHGILQIEEIASSPGNLIVPGTKIEIVSVSGGICSNIQFDCYLYSGWNLSGNVCILVEEERNSLYKDEGRS
jgi:hypothetical protein